jgi:ribonuclease J
MYQSKSGGSLDNLRIIPISGVEYVGANSAAIEYGDESVVIDAGIGFPDAEQFGVDFFIPNTKYYQTNKKKIKALVITHGHWDHIGAIPYLIEDMGFPTVYASRFAKELILENLSRNFKELIPKVKVVEINNHSKLKIGNMNLEFFRVNHSIPESMGIFINTPAGNVLHTGDFKIDNSPVNDKPTEFAKIGEFSRRGVLCMLSDSTNSMSKGYSASERDIAIELEDLVKGLNSRIIISTFSSMGNRIMQLLKIAMKYKKRVYVAGRSMQNSINIAKKIGYIKIPDDLLIRTKDLENVPKDKLMIISTGSQGEDLAALARMSRNEHNEIKVQKGDSIILSSSVIPGNGAIIQKMIDNLIHQGANVYHNDILNIHTSGHGYQEEQKLMINMVNPTFFMPVHGFLSFLAEHKKRAIELGIPEKNVILPHNGDVIEISKSSWRLIGKMSAKPLAVSGSVVGDIGESLLEEREQLSHFGIFIFTLLIDSKTQKLLKEPSIITKGFVYHTFSKQILNQARELISDTYNKQLEENKGIQKEALQKKLQKFLYSQTEREPIIIPILNSI